MTTLEVDLYAEMVLNRAVAFRKKYEEYKLERCKDPKEKTERQWELNQLNALEKMLQESADKEMAEWVKVYDK